MLRVKQQIGCSDELIESCGREGITVAMLDTGECVIILFKDAENGSVCQEETSLKEDFAQMIRQVVEQHVAYNGYTTCMCHNLLHSRILYDKNGKLTSLQNKYRIPYPDELRENIINRCKRIF